MRRRTLLLALAAQGCAARLPPLTAGATSAEAQALLDASAAAHGLAAFQGLRDVSVAYAGEWRGLVDRLQPELVDAGFRGGSEERLLLGSGLIAQSHTGPAGRKQVVRRPGVGADSVRVWFNDAESSDPNRRAAAALVTDGYALFLLGPLRLVGRAGLLMERLPAETIETADGRFLCDALRMRAAPGLGLAPADDLVLFIDVGTRLMRRVRFTLEGLESTQNAVAEVDVAGHVPRAGVQWPTRFHERLLRPLPIAVHDWRMTGLDLDRGMDEAELVGPSLVGRAAGPATPLD